MKGAPAQAWVRFLVPLSLWGGIRNDQVGHVTIN